MSEYLDSDGYPTVECLRRIKNWPYTDPMGLYDFLTEVWAYYEPEIDGTTLKLSTAGWSGNEDIIDALKENTAFYMIYWMESRRGGHYKFDLSRNPKESNETKVPK